MSGPPPDTHMRNYPPFPKATPHLGTDCPRAPHPSATGTPESAPFDLHALGTPPALILSQDQTLHHICCCAHPQAETRAWDVCLFVLCVRAPGLPKETRRPLRLPRTPLPIRSTGSPLTWIATAILPDDLALRNTFTPVANRLGNYSPNSRLLLRGTRER